MAMSRACFSAVIAVLVFSLTGVLYGVPFDPAQLQAKTATLKGRVTYDGTPPKPRDLGPQVKLQQDKPHCLKGPDAERDREWVVKDGNVANVAIWLRAPGGKHFEFTEQDKKSWPTEVKVDQPFCHFEPHVSVAFPRYFDSATKKYVETGQQIKVLNSAPITHNVKWVGEVRKVPGGNYTVQAKGEVALPLAPDWTTPVRLNCGIHKWMEGYIWALETPYAAVTKEDGTYEIKGVPPDAELQLVVWHEAIGFVAGPAGEKITLKPGHNVKDYKIKAK
jgi:hypothetical protein